LEDDLKSINDNQGLPLFVLFIGVISTGNEKSKTLKNSIFTVDQMTKTKCILH
jgi:hypothetical protein